MMAYWLCRDSRSLSPFPGHPDLTLHTSTFPLHPYALPVGTEGLQGGVPQLCFNPCPLLNRA